MPTEVQHGKHFDYSGQTEKLDNILHQLTAECTRLHIPFVVALQVSSRLDSDPMSGKTRVILGAHTCRNLAASIGALFSFILSIATAHAGVGIEEVPHDATRH